MKEKLKLNRGAAAEADKPLQLQGRKMKK